MALEFASQLVKNIREFNKINNETVAAEHSRDSLFACLKEQTAKKAALITQNNEIINGQLRPLLANPRSICEEDADKLFALTQKLYTYTVNLDIGIALEIHLSLIQYAKINNDCDRLVRSLYSAGFIYLQFFTRFKTDRDFILYAKKALHLFTKGASYKARYFTVENRETRMYIHRCIANVYVIQGSLRSHDDKKALAPFLDSIDTALRFWRDEKVRSYDPSFPWDAYINNTHQNICAWIDVLRKQSTENRDIALAMRVYNSYKVLEENLEYSDSRYWSDTRTRYVKYNAHYFMGKISPDNFLNEMRGLFYQVEDDDYSNKGLYGMLSIPDAIITHIRDSARVIDKWVLREIDAIINRIINYLKKMPKTVDRQEAAGYISSCSKHILERMGFTNYMALLLKLVSFDRMTNYVHALQVQRLSEILSAHLIQSQPELFSDVNDAGDTAALMQLISQAALYHDLYRTLYLDTGSACSRRLYEFETFFIQKHTCSATLKEIGSVEADSILHVIQGHHKWYDGSDGYPKWFDNRSSKYKIIIDIVSVADSIAAATDTVCRSYAPPLSLEEIIAEIRKQAGTRYSPFIAKALQDEGLLSAVRACITEGLKDACFKAYNDIHIDDRVHVR
jgi:HD-GYP domain-containing protein (c-di-GMP phosphodiesterase class II)